MSQNDDMISRQAAIDEIETLGFVFSDSDLSAVELEELDEAINDVRQAWLQRIKQLPSAQQSRLERAVAGKSPEEIYDFLYWLMFYHARAYTDSRAAVIAWLKGESDG